MGFWGFLGMAFGLEFGLELGLDLGLDLGLELGLELRPRVKGECVHTFEWLSRKLSIVL